MDALKKKEERRKKKEEAANRPPRPPVLAVLHEIKKDFQYQVCASPPSLSLLPKWLVGSGRWKVEGGCEARASESDKRLAANGLLC